jgi:hypothetical protein
VKIEMMVILPTEMVEIQTVQSKLVGPALEGVLQHLTLELKFEGIARDSTPCQLIAMTGTPATTMDEVVLVLLRQDTPDQEGLLQQLILVLQFEVMAKRSVVNNEMIVTPQMEMVETPLAKLKLGGHK